MENKTRGGRAREEEGARGRRLREGRKEIEREREGYETRARCSHNGSAEI